MPSATVLTLSAAEARDRVSELASVLVDCVEDGASVSFMEGLSHHEATDFWRGIADDVEAGTRVLFAAQVDGRILGTVQLTLCSIPNQLHRADINKLLVHRDGRERGLARALMDRAESDARERGLALLCLDTMTNSPAERLYDSLDWLRIGVVPDYAALPNGRLEATTFFYKPLTQKTPRTS